MRDVQGHRYKEIRIDEKSRRQRDVKNETGGKRNEGSWYKRGRKEECGITGGRNRMTRWRRKRKKIKRWIKKINKEQTVREGHGSKTGWTEFGGLTERNGTMHYPVPPQSTMHRLTATRPRLYSHHVVVADLRAPPPTPFLSQPLSYPCLPFPNTLIYHHQHSHRSVLLFQSLLEKKEK